MSFAPSLLFHHSLKHKDVSSSCASLFVFFAPESRFFFRRAHLPACLRSLCLPRTLPANPPLLSACSAHSATQPPLCAPCWRIPLRPTPMEASLASDLPPGAPPPAWNLSQPTIQCPRRRCQETSLRRQREALQAPHPRSLGGGAAARHTQATGATFPLLWCPSWLRSARPL